MNPTECAQIVAWHALGAEDPGTFLDAVFDALATELGAYVAAVFWDPTPEYVDGLVDQPLPAA